jgi:hypothetical protein
MPNQSRKRRDGVNTTLHTQWLHTHLTHLTISLSPTHTPVATCNNQTTLVSTPDDDCKHQNTLSQCRIKHESVTMTPRQTMNQWCTNHTQTMPKWYPNDTLKQHATKPTTIMPATTRQQLQTLTHIKFCQIDRRRRHGTVATLTHNGVHKVLTCPRSQSATDEPAAHNVHMRASLDADQKLNNPQYHEAKSWAGAALWWHCSLDSIRSSLWS